MNLPIKILVNNKYEVERVKRAYITIGGDFPIKLDWGHDAACIYIKEEYGELRMSYQGHLNWFYNRSEKQVTLDEFEKYAYYEQ